MHTRSYRLSLRIYDVRLAVWCTIMPLCDNLRTIHASTVNVRYYYLPPLSAYDLGGGRWLPYQRIYTTIIRCHT